MKTGVTIHGCAIHIGHGYLATAGHCVQLPGILREIEAKPKISLRLFWGSGSLYHPERCKRFQAYQATLVAVSPEIKNVWSTAEGIRTVDDVAGLLDFAFLRIAEPVSKLGKTFRFQHFLIPSRLPETTAEHAVGLLAANGEIGTSLYYEKYVQFMRLNQLSNLSIKGILSCLLKKGTRSKGPWVFHDDTADGIETVQVDGTGHYLRHNCPNLQGASGGALILQNQDTQKSIGINTASEVGLEVAPGQYQQRPAHKNLAILWEGSLLECFKTQIVPMVQQTKEYLDVTRAWNSL
ncbi:protein of unknown function [Taphrina deformans PYCC 5710]|uniref:Peptidase S1 domain-containing protein n=1 Tax=Taphrina deformans (strain PYCC 5710 / ATCC 11124 / CBS 356.35 / IMI 108563 / JCM 9778 / NBRC 8474) TaxID=1097556 RepID=R4XHZ9_TAPDE|nr:protein of unknown function [Taphrina deformans PYCC 5710]|eukprot:CCG83027.1 protein of unknown function [Taphrina deformans PYCC 5710]